MGMPFCRLPGARTMTTMNKVAPQNHAASANPQLFEVWQEQICYQHCVLKHVNRKPMINATLRERFGIEAKNSSQISRIIKDALSKKLIKLYDPEAGPRLRRYIPCWA